MVEFTSSKKQGQGEWGCVGEEEKERKGTCTERGKERRGEGGEMERKREG